MAQESKQLDLEISGLTIDVQMAMESILGQNKYQDDQLKSIDQKNNPLKEVLHKFVEN